ncbi:D-xylose ABC transporter substrate-binding protein [Sulfitobacter pseudonitzschiae]|uniref:D-xylose ABC transporter substrate-binding protein n=2 Tax=Roseobacteraceae TaxID=2854170 RepID=A0A9Q2S0Y6_9RHOB|nr:D-xylose ABC transporter substrate-binding protein [Pseudosulfitobacter pseudonitzschiae]MBM2297804.1 D-xylose ABC transporter substrate-binding protein [Pseudosulfitobacter pseudonitzschiae]MBM2302718.1 D-xylose ABC transporter substrate-binding protein [Pseudosulfitobacter pseudonitzschiae]MBM2312616.1 D-xylose ABC transporter substrate-binding protein [Pseudosulfitobacter pseudonitzschiae]MBM2317414.1 D-xylose ABC transporter substrate-binding protein [Pseudosulfitobacter pseudonitzschiae|tara:strand:- start:1306 stop:2334 length:1029 start_codon:yes stop_codon:yes gene_type:complete
MKFIKTVALAATMTVTAVAAWAQDVTVGVSWSNFQEERWKTDEAAMKEAIEAAGAKYISADAQASAAKQLTDVEALIAQGATALIILSVDKDAIGPAIDQADNEGIPVVGYDRLIEDPRAFYLTFDNKGVGRIIAQSVTAVQPEGNFAIIKGDKGDPNALFLLEGMMEVIGADVDAGKIKIVGEAFTDGWKPDNAQRNMEQILTANDNNVDAVLAENDGMAGGAIAALQAQGLNVPVGGQDGDHAALNRVARGTQTVSVWKDSRQLGKKAAEIALALADGTAMADVDGAEMWSGGEKGVEMTAIFLAPTPITKDNISDVIDAGHIEKDKVCAGAMDGVKGCN